MYQLGCLTGYFLTFSYHYNDLLHVSSSGDSEPLLRRRGALHVTAAAGGRGSERSQPEEQEEEQESKEQEERGTELCVLLFGPE